MWIGSIWFNFIFHQKNLVVSCNLLLKRLVLKISSIVGGLKSPGLIGRTFFTADFNPQGRLAE